MPKRTSAPGGMQIHIPDTARIDTMIKIVYQYAQANPRHWSGWEIDGAGLTRMHKGVEQPNTSQVVVVALAEWLAAVTRAPARRTRDALRCLWLEYDNARYSSRGRGSALYVSAAMRGHIEALTTMGFIQSALTFPFSPPGKKQPIVPAPLVCIMALAFVARREGGARLPSLCAE